MVATADIDWLVISLARTPERLEKFRTINAHVDLPIEVLVAVDGKTVDRAELVREGLMPEDLPWVDGAIGAALSHRLCWLQAVETGRPVCIFEDDVYLRQDFVARSLGVIGDLPPDWDLVHFGYNTDAIFDVEVLPGFNVRGMFSAQSPTLEDCERFVHTSGSVTPVRVHNAFGNCAYAVSPAGARKLLDWCFPLNMRLVSMPTTKVMLVPYSKDGVMNGMYRDSAAYVVVPPLAMPHNDKPASTVKVG